MANAALKSLVSLQTPFGKRGVYDSVCYCNRCGLCARVCPSYQETQQEPFSPRGRNQALKLLFNRKFKTKTEQKLLQEMFFSCTLCGRCTQACPGKIPTAQHMLELRRKLGISCLPVVLFYMLRLRQQAPRLFAGLVKGGLLLRKIGVLQLLSYVPGFVWLKHMLEILPTQTAKVLPKEEVKNPTQIYLPSLEAEFLMPNLYHRTYQLLNQQGGLVVWKNTASGLFEYVYGDLRQARRLMRRLMTRHAQTMEGKLPLVTDSIDVYNFLMSAPQLFAGFPMLEKKAENFIRQIRFVADFLPGENSSSIAGKVQFMPTALFSLDTLSEQKIKQKLHTLFGKNFVQCEYKEGIIPPLGYGFVKHTRASAYALQAVRTVATHQAQIVFVPSGLAALELVFYLRKFYPTAQVRHIIELNG